MISLSKLIMHKKVWLLRIPLFGLLVMSLLSACLDEALEPMVDNSPLGIVRKLNKNAMGLRNLASACIAVDSVAIFSIGYTNDGSVLYLLNMKEGENIELYSEIVSQEFLVPELSMEWEGNDFFWTINGVPLFDLEGKRVSVTDLTKSVTFFLSGELVCCQVNNTVVGEYLITKSGSLVKDVIFDYDVDNRSFQFQLSSGFNATLPTISGFHLLEENVLNRSYYKDVFLDAGIGLTSRRTLAATEYLGLSLECISLPQESSRSKDNALQKAIVSGDSRDLNGRLLYPDGQPRYKLLFVNGGISTDHGQSLGEKGLEAMRVFVENGGSYVGTCAGAFFASNGYNGKKDYPYYLSIWPGMMRQSGLKDIYTGMIIEKNSPLLDYYDFGKDHYVDSVRHNLGGYPVKFPLRTEILARYDYPSKSGINRQPSIWAYKSSPQTGRIVMTGSHPEGVMEGERRDLTAAMIRYAMEGGGSVKLTGFLKNGEERVMDKTTADNDPAYTRIGDLQTHHFASYIPSDAQNIKVKLDSPSDCDLALMMDQDSFAFADVSEYRSATPGARQQLSFPFLREGVWFIAVQCLTTVTVKETDYGQEYIGKTEVLNGIPYQISISWE